MRRSSESVVLGVRSYKDLLDSSQAQAIEQSVVANRTLLFIGCGDGLSDPNFGALLKWSSGAFGKSIYRHYCLCRNSERASLEKQHAREERLFFIEYGDKFEELEPFLHRELVRSRKPPPLLPSPGYCFGREREVAEVVSALLADDPQPLPILGGPGMGKTTIALKALHDKRVAQRFGARRWFVRCDGVKSRTELAAAIARALDLPITPSIEPTVLDALAMAPAALILDNAETPLDADGAQVEEFLSILATIESIALVVTIRGETRPRGVPWRSRTEAERLTGSAARETFVAAAGKSQFADDPELPHLLGVLDGAPLAITLMARFAEIFDSLEPVWSRWRAKRTEILKDGEKGGRLSDIAVSYEMSISVLSADARRLLSVLALLPDGIADRDLEGVFADPDNAADELRRRALVFEEAHRLRMLAPLREYVAAAYPPKATDERRTVNYYLGLAATEGRKVGAAGGADAVSRLAPEVANTEAMLVRSMHETYEDSRGAVYGWAQMMRFTGLGSTHPIEQVADHALAAGVVADAAAYMVDLGQITQMRSDYDTARSRFQQALSLYQTLGVLHGEANCIYSLGDIALRRSENEMARSRFEQALPLYQKLGEVLGEANCIKSLGDIALRRPDNEMARRRFEQARSLYQKLGDMLGEAECIRNLGKIALKRSDHQTASNRFEEALPLYQKVGALLGEANCIRSLGDIALWRSGGNSARSRFEQALHLYQTVGDLLGEANCLRSLGEIEFARGNGPKAESQYREALALYERIPEPFSIGHTRRRLARLTVHDGSHGGHVAAARQAWCSIKRDDLVAELDAEFGTDHSMR
jgi:tetratricopeptide (TPR) repeat protein